MYSVVIADDEKMICSAIRSVLETSVSQISSFTVFNDGEEASQWLRHNRADLLLLDIEMPGQTGLDIARMVRNQQADSYIVIITAYHEFDYAQQAIQASVNDFLTKPFSSKQLIASVEKGISFLENRASRQADRHLARRSLLLSLCRSDVTPAGYGDICFCKNSTPLKHLTCTEVTLTNIGPNTPDPSIQNVLNEKLILATESDSPEQTSLLIEQTDELIRILVLSRNTPNLSFTDNLCELIGFHTGSQPSCAHRWFPSFARYRAWLSCEREMNVLFDLLTNSSASHARKHIVSFIQRLNPTQLEVFSDFLHTDYHLDSAADPDAIIQAMDLLTKNHLTSDTGNSIIDSAMQYMQRNYASATLSLKSVSEALFISSSYLSRVFKKHTGRNFSDYLLNLRMEQAQTLLRTTSMPTTAIAAAVGYENLAYFRVSFKSYSGMTPSQFRQVHNTRKDVTEE